MLLYNWMSLMQVLSWRATYVFGCHVNWYLYERCFGTPFAGQTAVLAWRRHGDHLASSRSMLYNQILQNGSYIGQSVYKSKHYYKRRNHFDKMFNVNVNIHFCVCGLFVFKEGHIYLYDTHCFCVAGQIDMRCCYTK